MYLFNIKIVSIIVNYVFNIVKGVFISVNLLCGRGLVARDTKYFSFLTIMNMGVVFFAEIFEYYNIKKTI